MKLTEYLEVQKYKFKREAISKSHPRDLSAPTHTHTSQSTRVTNLVSWLFAESAVQKLNKWN